jgi:hypothetical protein
MNPDTRATGALRPGDEAAPGALPADIVAQRLIAVPWRHAGLIVLLALAGGLASTTFWPPPAPVPVRAAAARSHVQAIQDAPSPADAGIALRLELDFGAAAPPMLGFMQTAAAPPSSSSLRLDGTGGADEIEAELRQAPPAGGRLLTASPEPAPEDGDGRSPALPGLAAGLLLGLLLGLLVAALRELGGDRMRSPREAQWALGAPVLGAIPTLSAKARDALLEPPPAVPGAA